MTFWPPAPRIPSFYLAPRTHQYLALYKLDNLKFVSRETYACIPAIMWYNSL